MILSISWNDYITNQFNIIEKITTFLREILDKITYSYIGKTIIYLMIISIVFMLIIKIYELASLNTEADKENELVKRNIRIQDKMNIERTNGQYTNYEAPLRGQGINKDGEIINKYNPNPEDIIILKSKKRRR